jgi:cell division transport system permease protein
MNQFKGGRSGGAKEAPAGAVQGHVGFGIKIGSWLSSHRDNSRESLIRLWTEPVQSLMTVLVIAIAIALPAALWIAVSNLQQLSGSWQNSARISMYINKNQTESVIQDLIDGVEEMPQVETVKYIAPEVALGEFKQTSGFGEVLTLLDANPLPGVLLLTPIPELIDDPGGMTVLIDELSGLKGIAEVQLDMQWLQRLQQILALGRRVSVLLGLALALGVLLVVGNTIRLAIESRRDEILVVKLVGGTNGFVRRPFLYTGLWYGLFGGLIAWVGVILGGLWINHAVVDLAILYKSNFSLVGIGGGGLGILMILGGTLGLLGAALAVSRHIARIEP